MTADPPSGVQHDDLLLPGTRIGQYEIRGLIGRGGMASVYRAIQTTLDRPVALKVMAPLLSTQPSFRQRFLKEAQTVARLSHPNIVTVHDFGEASLRHYLALEYIGGGDLKTRINGGSLQPNMSLSVLKEMAQALSYAHQKGFVHRDVKPENILFHESGQAMLTDFGIALAVESGTRMTGTGMSIGTPHYMSPEQCQGEQELDGRSDLYSLGIVFYEMLTGKVPYDANNTVGIVMKHVQAPVPELPPALAMYQPILDGLLAKDRNSRFSSATELIKAIEAIQSGAQPRSPKSAQRPPNKTTVIPTPPRPGVAQRHAAMEEPYKAKQSSSHGFVWALGGAALAAVIAIGAWVYYQPAPMSAGGGVALPVAGTPSGTANSGRSPPAGQASNQRTQPASSPLERQLAMAKSGIRVSPGPATASIYVDGAYAGSGTLELTDLQGGSSVTIRAEAEGYQALEQVVRVPTDRMLQLTMDLDKVIPRYAFTIEPDPADAKVRILNIEPVYQKGMLLEPGKYQVEVSKPGYVTETRWVELAGQAVSASIQLRPANFALTIQTNPSDAIVRLLEPARNYQAGMVLAPGRYRYEVTKPGFNEHQGMIELADHDVVERVELAPGWKSGETFKDCNECPEMVVIPAGSFQMGSPPNEKDRSSDEGPQHGVTISQPFALGKYEVTFDEYDVFARATGKSLPSDSGWGRGRRPVIYVSWEDAQAYAKWLSQRTGERYRLPSEAEWEYAARAGTTSAYWWGSSVTCSQAVYGYKECNRNKTESVGSYRANAFGLYDVHGNVWEWTEDCWNWSYSGAPADGAAWTRGDCGRRVLRGGSWYHNPRLLRAADRIRGTPSSRLYNGFRLARTL